MWGKVTGQHPGFALRGVVPARLQAGAVRRRRTRARMPARAPTRAARAGRVASARTLSRSTPAATSPSPRSTCGPTSAPHYTVRDRAACCPPACGAAALRFPQRAARDAPAHMRMLAVPCGARPAGAHDALRCNSTRRGARLAPMEHLGSHCRLQGSELTRPRGARRRAAGSRRTRASRAHGSTRTSRPTPASASRCCWRSLASRPAAATRRACTRTCTARWSARSRPTGRCAARCSGAGAWRAATTRRSTPATPCGGAAAPYPHALVRPSRREIARWREGVDVHSQWRLWGASSDGTAVVR